MKSNKWFLALLIITCAGAVSCDKLQDGYDYERSYYDNKLNKSVWEFMESRTDMFSGMMDAINYVDQSPNNKDVKQLYTNGNANTFLLLHNNALTNLEDANSYWVLNKVMAPNPDNPSQMILQRGSDWSQYHVDTIANMLRYHVLKGKQTYSTLNSVGKWVESYAMSATNDSAKVYLYLENVREANLRVNNYVGLPTVYKGTSVNWTNIAPRTPDLMATDGTVHVMNRFFFQPTKLAIQTN